MGILLVRENEHLTCDVSGVTFHYRRPTNLAIQKIREKHTSRGKLDDEAFADEMLRHCVFNWEGPISADDSGETIAFDPALLEALPVKVKVTLVEVISDMVDGRHQKVDPT